MLDTTQALRDGAAALEEVDATVADAVLPIRHSPAVRLVGTLSELGDQPQMRTLAAGVIGTGLLIGNPRLARAGLRMLVAHEAATAVKTLIKRNVDRTRPRSLADGEAPQIRKGENHDKEASSFPSGHSAGAAATARGFVREFPEHAGPAHSAAGLVALAQIPRCAHYPTDVGVGIAIGLAAEAITDRAMTRLFEWTQAED